MSTYLRRYPADTQCRFNVYKTSIGRIDVLLTLKRRRVSTGDCSNHVYLGLIEGGKKSLDHKKNCRRCTNGFVQSI